MSVLHTRNPANTKVKLFTRDFWIEHAWKVQFPYSETKGTHCSRWSPNSGTHAKWQASTFLTEPSSQLALPILLVVMHYPYVTKKLFKHLEQERCSLNVSKNVFGYTDPTLGSLLPKPDRKF